MDKNIALMKEKVAALHAVESRADAEGDGLKDRIEILKDAALTLLDEVEAMKDARPVNLRHGIKLDEEVQRFERDLIRQALERTGGHQTRAARLLGVNLTTLHYKIKRHQLRLPDVDDPQALDEARLTGT